MRLEVGPFGVDDLTYSAVVDGAVSLAVGASVRPVRAYALHVGGLNHRGDRAFVQEMNSAELVYPDGVSIVSLGRLAGARNLERAPTTDLGWDILHGLGWVLGRPARVAMIGGPPGLAERAGQVLETEGAGTVAFSADGYQTDWSAVLAELRDAGPDIVIVGLGAPREMLWVREWTEHLPPTLVLTCGGWFGFLVGDERRGHSALRRSGLEWIARLRQSPRRLGPRYARGVASSVVVGGQTLLRRRR